MTRTQLPLEAWLREADQAFAEDPDGFAVPRFGQPGGVHLSEAEALLGDDAPWHHVAYVAQKLEELEDTA